MTIIDDNIKRLFFVLLILAGCSDPKPDFGDWYEHKGTRERIQIMAAGLGKDLIRIHGADFVPDKSNKELSQYLWKHKKKKDTILWYSKSNDDDYCVLTIAPSGNKVMITIQRVESFLKDHSKVQ
ncbi:MAG: hypothetical protein HBSIN02_25290 [Bacteroidia bacterium]|nr:MAG: hypothetical protein HBSIN02_25290 [Bacteroidia bacterium]